MSKSNTTDFEQAYVNQWLETFKRSALVHLLLEGLNQSSKWSGDLVTFIEKSTNGNWAVDDRSLYRALRRLEKQGLIDHEAQKPSGRGAKRKVYSITESGQRVLTSINQLMQEPNRDPKQTNVGGGSHPGATING